MSWLPNTVINWPLTSKQQLCSVLLKGSLTQTVTLQRSAVSCSRKSTPWLVAHAGTIEWSVFVPTPFPPFWLIFTGRKCWARLAQEAGALNFILLMHCCSCSHTNSFLCRSSQSCHSKRCWWQRTRRQSKNTCLRSKHMYVVSGIVVLSYNTSCSSYKDHTSHFTGREATGAQSI